MEEKVFCETIKNEAKKLQIDLDEKMQENFYDYMNLLLEWNEKINLTAITDEKEIITKHFIDSLTILKYIDADSKIADIGTGAGFPGIPLVIAKPSIKLTLVDSLNKRTMFLNEAIKKLHLNNVEVLHNRAEEFGKNKQYREIYNIAVSRAVAKINVLAEYLLPTVKVGGKCICMKGPDVQEELNEAKNAIKILGGKIEAVDEFVLPGTNMNRSIVVLNKIRTTPSKYPRKPGTPAKLPL